MLEQSFVDAQRNRDPAFSLRKEQESAMRHLFVMAVLPTRFAEEFNFSVVCQCKMKLTSLHDSYSSVHLLFSVRSLELLVVHSCL